MTKVVIHFDIVLLILKPLFVGDPLEPPQRPLGVARTHFENH